MRENKVQKNPQREKTRKKRKKRKKRQDKHQKYFVSWKSLHFWSKGNLGRVDRINDFEYDLFVRPDVANPRFRFWFNFTIENVQEGQVNWSKSQK